MEGRGSPVLFSPVLFFDHTCSQQIQHACARRAAEGASAGLSGQEVEARAKQQSSGHVYQGTPKGECCLEGGFATMVYDHAGLVQS